jgi:hypothetical protein
MRRGAGRDSNSRARADDAEFERQVEPRALAKPFFRLSDLMPEIPDWIRSARMQWRWRGRLLVG